MNEETTKISTEITPATAVDALVGGFFSVIDITSQRLEEHHGGLGINQVYEALLTVYVKAVESSLDQDRHPLLAMIDLDRGARYMWDSSTEFGRVLMESDDVPDDIKKPINDYTRVRSTGLPPHPTEV